MKKLFSLILVGMLAVSGLSAKVKLSVLYVGGTANMDPILMSPGSCRFRSTCGFGQRAYGSLYQIP